VQVKVSFKGDNLTSRTLPFPYDSRYGIDTKILLGGVVGHVSGPGGPCAQGLGTLTPQCAPFAFPVNVTIRDNYEWGCGRVAYSVWSGCPHAGQPVLGAGTLLLNNHAEHCIGSYLWSVDGVNIAREWRRDGRPA
jgi:hypothetical protein